MFYKEKAASDAFAFALGGIATVGAFAPVPVVASDRINKAWDERLSQPKDDAPRPTKGARTSPGLIGALRFLKAT